MDALRPDDPRSIGPHRLVGRLGAGGMGQVYLAESPGGRRVAVKVVRSEHVGDPEFRARFAREVEAARRVGGFYAAQVVDADTGAPEPWMATAYIPGPPLRRVAPLEPAEVARLGAALAEGLTAIHDCGLVHRDLKPGNVIMSDDGPRIIDFGIARSADASSLTATGAVLGTYAYMAPEQVRGEPSGTPADVFALGCVLAFAASGRGPFDAATIPAIVHRVLHEQPDLSALPDPLRPLVEACLAKDPDTRPSTADVLAHLADPDAAPPRLPPPAPAAGPPEAVFAPRETPAAQPAVSRRRALIVGGAAAGTAVVAAAVGGATALLLRDDDPAPAAKPSAPVGNAMRPPSAQLTGHENQVGALAFSPDGRLVASGGMMEDRALVWDVATGRRLLDLRTPAGVNAVAFSPDGRLVATGHMNATAALWDATSGERLRLLRSTEFSVNALAFSPDGRTLAGANPDVRLWDTSSGRVTAQLTGTGKHGVDAVAFSRDGRRVTAGLDGFKPGSGLGSVMVWDVRTKKRVAHVADRAKKATSVHYTPDGRTMITSGMDATIRLWDAGAVRITGTIPTGHSDLITSSALSADGRTLVSGSNDRTARVIDLAARRVVATLGGDGARVSAVAVSPDGRTVVGGGGTSSAQSTIHVWRLA